MWAAFDPAAPGYQFVHRAPWIPALGVEFHLGVDGVSLLFVVLSNFLTLVCVIASWESVTERVKEYAIAFLVMAAMMNGVFCALDIVLFYLFFEAILIPMFLIIGVWGGKRRVYSAFKFFLYTLAGSVLFLVAVLAMARIAGETAIPVLAETAFDPGLQIWLWLALFASFAVKIPMWPFHTWLPDAHVEAPTAGSVILAGVLLKLGAYGFLRFSLPMLPDATAFFTPFVHTLSVVAVIWASLVALMQTDMKKLIAYSSVAHMGFVTIGLFTLTTQGVEGALMVMLSHGVVSAALFLCVGVVYDRNRSREIADYGGLVHRMPAYAFVFMVFTMASIGLPRHERFRRRVPGARRRLPAQHLDRRRRRPRRHPRRRLHALALPPRDLRRACEREAEIHRRSQAARDRDVRAASRRRALDGRVSGEFSRRHAGVGRAADRAVGARRRRRRGAGPRILRRRAWTRSPRLRPPCRS